MWENNPFQTWGMPSNGAGYNVMGDAGAPALSDQLMAPGAFQGNQGGGNWYDALFDREGMGMPALAAGQGIFNAWLGMKQYGLYKDQLAESKRQFGLNYDAQKRTTNAALEDRQRARLASNPNAYQSLSSYMDKNAIQGG